MVGGDCFIPQKQIESEHHNQHATPICCTYNIVYFDKAQQKTTNETIIALLKAIYDAPTNNHSESGTLFSKMAKKPAEGWRSCDFRVGLNLKAIKL